MGGLRRSLPWTFGAFLCGALSISGFPFLWGFFSKEAILYHATERAFLDGPGWMALWALAVVTAAMTSFYTFRLVALAFFGKERGSPAGLSGHARGEIHEAPLVMMVPLYLLALSSVFGGWIDVQGFLTGHPARHDPRWSHLVLATSLGAFAFGLLGVWYLYLRAPGAHGRLLAWRPLFFLWSLSARKLYVDELYDNLVVKPFKALSFSLFSIVDRFLIDLLLVEGMGDLARGLGKLFRRVQSGRVPAYALWFMAGAVGVLALMAVRGGKYSAP